MAVSSARVHSLRQSEGDLGPNLTESYYGSDDESDNDSDSNNSINPYGHPEVDRI